MWSAFKAHWLTIAISYFCLPIADYLIYSNYGRAKASEWIWPTVMTQVFPITAIGIFATIFFVFLVAPYSLYRKKCELVEDLSSELQILKKSDISILFDINDARCAPDVTHEPTTLQSAAAAVMYPQMVQSGRFFRQICIVIENTSANQIDNVEIYCEEISVVQKSPEAYSLLPAGDFRAIHLCPGEPFRQGIIRETIDKSDQGTILSKQIEVTLPYKGESRALKGSEFLLKVLIVGRTLYRPKRCSYKFGDRDGELFFEENHDAPNS